MTDTVYVLGNGLSRKNINPYELKGPVIGCNACYRDFEPDILCAIDAGVISDIVNFGYNKPCYFTHNSWNPLPAEFRNQLTLGKDSILHETKNRSKEFVCISGFDREINEKVNYIIWVPENIKVSNIGTYTEGWSTGTSAAYVACKEFNPKKVYLLGFDLNYNDYHNIYANTDHYFKSDSDGWASVHREWLKQLTKLFNWFPDIQFYWLNKENHTTQQKNLHFIEDIWQV